MRGRQILNKHAKSLVLIGLDGAIMELIDRAMQEGGLPNVKKLVKNGIFTEVFPCPPCDTATNWTTIVTGAWPGTHGITSFHIHLSGEPLKEGPIGSIDSRLCEAEFIWDVAEKKGKKCLIFDYPLSWPPTIKRGIVIGSTWPTVGRGAGAGMPGRARRSKKDGSKDIYPEELAGKLEEIRSSSVTPTRALEAQPHPKDSFEGMLNYAEYEANYLIKAANFLKEDEHWDLLISHIHLEDSLNHSSLLTKLWSDHPTYSKTEAEKAWDVYMKSFKILDTMIGRIVKECTNEETLIVVISDHGCVPNSKIVWVGNALQRAGLLVYKKDPVTGRHIVDWTKTRAAFYFTPSEYIWVNLKGREEGGIVDPKDYEKVREEIINTLYAMRDPETGECPISVALRKEDAEILGHWGERCSDVIYFVKPQYYLPDFGFHYRFSRNPPWGDFPDFDSDTTEKALSYLLSMKADVVRQDPSYGGTHAGHFPTDKIGPGSIRAFCIMSGPEIKKGYRRSKPVWMVDIAPTISHLLGLPAPAHSEGRIIADIMK